MACFARCFARTKDAYHDPDEVDVSLKAGMQVASPIREDSAVYVQPSLASAGGASKSFRKGSGSDTVTGRDLIRIRICAFIY